MSHYIFYFQKKRLRQGLKWSLSKSLFVSVWYVCQKNVSYIIFFIKHIKVKKIMKPNKVFVRFAYIIDTLLGIIEICMLTDDAWVSGPNLAPQKILLSQKFRYLMRCKKYLEKIFLSCLVSEIQLFVYIFG